MEVVEEDSLRTELKRNKPSPGKIINIWQVKQRSAATAKPREESTELSAQRRLSAPPSWASLSPLSADSHVAVVSRGSAHTSMRRPAPSLEDSSRTWSVTPSPTPNTPAGRPSPLLMSSTPSRDKEEPFTDSADEECRSWRLSIDGTMGPISPLVALIVSLGFR